LALEILDVKMLSSIDSLLFGDGSLDSPDSKPAISDIYACLCRLMTATSFLCNLIWIEMMASILPQMQIGV
jgi:hypothetical protein